MAEATLGDWIRRLVPNFDVLPDEARWELVKYFKEQNERLKKVDENTNCWQFLNEQLKEET